MKGKHAAKRVFGFQKRKATKKQNNKRKILVITVAGILAMLVVLAVCGFIYANSILGASTQVEVDHEELAVTENAFDKREYINVALFGIDARTDSSEGRSDAIMILTIDKKHNKIKLSSIARDSYVNIDGVGKDKLTHAYAYGGAKLAVKTINQTYGMNITDYVSVNFFGIADIIDEIGGVNIDVDSAEMKVMNQNYVPELNNIGIPCEYITETGMQHLTGSQALAYLRNRYVGGDIGRGNRQKEVLGAIFDEVKKLNVTKYPGLVKMLLSHAETTLSSAEILSLGVDAATNLSEVVNFSLPTDNCNAKYGDDAFINGVWYYIYDLDIAKNELHDFINEEGKYAANTGE